MNNGRRGRKARNRGKRNPCTFCGHVHGGNLGNGRRWGKRECYRVRLEKGA